LTGKEKPRIGVLAIQGNYASHAQRLTEAGAEPVEVRKPEQLAGLDGLVLPGGESTTMLAFLRSTASLRPCRSSAEASPSSAPAPGRFCWRARFSIRRSAPWACSMRSSSATPMAARSTRPS
jgi:hypothetical protein